MKSKALSWAFFGVSTGLLALVVWTLFFGSAREGAWNHTLAGTPVGELPVYGFAGEPVPVRHPAVLYFFRRDCRFCPPAAERLKGFMASERGGAPPVFAITNEWELPQAYGSEFTQDVNVVRLSRTMPRLTFIEYLPLLVRTNSAGEIEAAYIGVPGRDVLARMFAPQGAGSAVR